MLGKMISEKRFTITAEPSLHDGLGEFLSQAKEMKADAYNATDNPGATLAPSSLGASVALKQIGKVPVMQITCRDRNSLGIQADLLSAQHFGIENILTMTGDHPLKGCKTAKPVFQFDSTTLLLAAKEMNEGKSACGDEMKEKTSFTVGCALSPTVSPTEPEVYKTKRKIDCGAEFFQTQPVFSIDSIEDFSLLYEKEFNEDIRSKIIVGILPIYSTKLLGGVKALPGLIVSEEYENKIKNAKDAEEESASLSTELLDKIKSNSYAGVHIMTFGKASLHNKIAQK